MLDLQAPQSLTGALLSQIITLPAWQTLSSRCRQPSWLIRLPRRPQLPGADHDGVLLEACGQLATDKTLHTFWADRPDLRVLTRTVLPLCCFWVCSRLQKPAVQWWQHRELSSCWIPCAKEVRNEHACFQTECLSWRLNDCQLKNLRCGIQSAKDVLERPAPEERESVEDLQPRYS